MHWRKRRAGQEKGRGTGDREGRTRKVWSSCLGELDSRDDDVTVELPMTTLARILKVTQFSKQVAIVCEPQLPMRLVAGIGRYGSEVNVYIQQQPPPGHEMMKLMMMGGSGGNNNGGGR